MTVTDIYEELRKQAEKIVSTDNYNGSNIICLSGSKSRKRKLTKLINQYKNINDMLYELGMLEDDIYFYDRLVYSIMARSMKEYRIINEV